MTEQDLLLLSAYLDGQLDAGKLADFEDRLQREPELRQRLEAMRETDAALQAGFSDIMQEPVPEGIRQLLAESPAVEAKTKAPVIDLHAQKKRRAPSNWVPLSVAASVALAVGIFIGGSQTGDNMENILLSQTLQPADALVQILESSPSGNLNTLDELAAASVQAELSFIDNRGDFCRQYRIQNSERAFRGIACLENQQWHNVLLVPTGQQTSTSTYQPASGHSDLIIGHYLDHHMQGIALGKAEEEEQLQLLRSGQ